MYRGIRGEGTLQKHHNSWYIKPDGRNPWLTDPNGKLFVGDDQPIKWDEEKNMWYAPADYD